jgi:hypothetical protein
MYPPAIVASFLPAEWHHSLGVVAIVITSIGMWLQWRLAAHRENAEEAVKDGKLTELQARRRIQLFGICSPAITVIGVALLLVLAM